MKILSALSASLLLMLPATTGAWGFHDWVLKKSSEHKFTIFTLNTALGATEVGEQIIINQPAYDSSPIMDAEEVGTLYGVCTLTALVPPTFYCNIEFRDKNDNSIAVMSTQIIDDEENDDAIVLGGLGKYKGSTGKVVADFAPGTSGTELQYDFCLWLW